MIGATRADTPADVAAHPPFWVVHGKSATAYLLSSVHLLPPDISWHTPAIDAAVKSASTFIFEVPSGQDDEAEATRFILAHGLLPPGQTLVSLLSPTAQMEYVEACALAGMRMEQLNNKRPWLAAVVLTVSYMNQRHLSADATPDEELLALAGATGKSLVYLDTTDEQLEFLLRYDEVSGVNGFSKMLGSFQSQPAREDALIDAWSAGDARMIEKLIDRNFAGDPEGRKLIDAHNRAWTNRLEGLLDQEGTYFVTVGVAHLVGPAGMPALLRDDGYEVEGP